MPLLIVGAIVLVYLVVKKFWSKAEKLWDHAKQGGAILANKRDYVVKVLLPSFGSWLAKLAVIGVFLAAYNIPVTFHTIMSVVGGNSLANTVSFTPGGVGVTQAVNSVSLSSVTSPTNAAAYSLGQQIIVTAWNCVFALVLVVWVFGWTGGKQLVGRVVHRRQGEGGGAVGGPQGPPGREEGGQAVGRRRLIRSRRSRFTAARMTTRKPTARHRVGRTAHAGPVPLSSKEPAVVAASYPFMDVLWSMMIFFLFVIWIWILITVFADIFRRRDIGGGMKAVWIIFVILLPYLGVFIYLIAEGHHMAERNAEQIQTVQSAAGRLHQVGRRQLAGRPDRAGQVAARQRRDHPGRVRRPQGQGTQLGTRAGRGAPNIGAPRPELCAGVSPQRLTAIHRICESGRITPGRTRSSHVERRPNMCRWLAYSGSPVLLEELLVKPAHSLIDQSKHSRLGATTTNGDGFGVGWYGEPDTPGVFHGTEPAWNDRNLRDIAAHISSPLIFAHIRASTGTAVQETNCHPFRHDNWLWMHNGAIRDFPRVKRDLALAVDPSLYPLIEGSTDSELFFFLALTLGLEDNPPLAVERAVGLIEETGRRHDVEHPIQMTVATTDGDSIWAFRYSSERDSRSLFFSTEVQTLRHQYPDNPVLHGLSDETRIVLSEPLGDLAGAWNAVPESSWGVVQPGQDELHPFTPGAHPEQLGDRPRLERAAGGGVRRRAVGGLGDRADPPLAEVRVEALEDARRSRHPTRRAASTYGPISHGHTVPW